ncbi:MULTISPECIES: DsbA family protein [Marinobacter]|uniref:Disulfide bond formation protein DsbA n=1 Tax=Marinobacter profundi TaxID=2666256 RepID=A0A2G1UNA0_9GAMM|nr:MULTISPECIES: thioredoxin domain-containing protein [Marinobacter]MBD3655068.1 DsbA family protein [Marinobacter sp.]PHQ15981.1 disulfide bond formation protein DsbA [Marinobacter profundi]
MGEAKRRKETGAPVQHSRNKRNPVLLGGLIAAAVVIIIAVFFFTAAPEPTSNELPVAAANAEPFPAQLDRFGIAVGPEDAAVVVREFADYQCPACGRFAEASQQLKQQYVDTGKVRFVYFDLPLQQHQNAMPAAQAARCAGDQDAYWPMHDKLYGMQSEWSGSGDPVATFSRYASDLGLDERRFNRCMSTELHREAVEQSLQVAMQLRVASTPTVLVDNVRLTRPGWGQLSAVIERELAAARD